MDIKRAIEINEALIEAFRISRRPIKDQLPVVLEGLSLSELLSSVEIASKEGLGVSVGERFIAAVYVAIHYSTTDEPLLVLADKQLTLSQSQSQQKEEES